MKDRYVRSKLSSPIRDVVGMHDRNRQISGKDQEQHRPPDMHVCESESR
jgi:hypothetical protein